MIEPLRVALWPPGPVHVAEEPHVPPEQLELPLRVVVLPRGPVYDWDELQAPLAHEPCPEELHVPPCGPVPPPERFQPASAIEAPPAMSAAAMQKGASADLLRVIGSSPTR
ncbi:MAG TPA: hypothetical protein VK961_04580 [Chthoniobacter sp.]|nr:hypothetical protein [Chthoniobacter sp.]